MRKVVDPSWECGFGFGSVKRKRTDLALPWEDPVFSFVAQETSFLDELQEQLLEQPTPVPLPAPADTKATNSLSLSVSLPQPEASGQPGRKTGGSVKMEPAAQGGAALLS